jgi:hypothetical protein
MANAMWARRMLRACLRGARRLGRMVINEVASPQPNGVLVRIELGSGCRNRHAAPGPVTLVALHASPGRGGMHDITH